MKTKRLVKEGISFTVPESFEFPKDMSLQEIPSCCGAGEGISEKAIPETLWGLKISAACLIHDVCWEEAEAIEEDFHQSNVMFLQNLMSIVAENSTWFMKILRNYRATTYFNAVDTVGRSVFWKLKEKQRKA